MSGKAAILHRKYLCTWLIKSFWKPREVVDCKEIVAASGLGFSIMIHIIVLFHFVVAPLMGGVGRNRSGEDVVLDPW